MTLPENALYHLLRSSASAASKVDFKPAKTWGEYCAMSPDDQKRDVEYTLRQWGAAAAHTEAATDAADYADNGLDGTEPTPNSGA